jgi:phosphoglycerate dehydrogenase-like enzyme
VSIGLDVLILPHPLGPEMHTPWLDDLHQAVAGRHRLRTWDATRPLNAQLDGIDAVVDQGGYAGHREFADEVSARVRLWQVLATGVEHIDLPYWRDRGIALTNCPGPFSAIALAEFSLMLMLMLSRRYVEARKNLDGGVFYRPIGSELDGKTLGIVGFGASGRELAVRARGFGMRLMAVDLVAANRQDIQKYGLDWAGATVDLDTMLGVSDFVSLHLPVTAETQHIIDARRLSLMKATAYLINVARGALIDETVLTRVLTAGEIAGAGLDVFDHEPLQRWSPLFDLPNVVATPHVAGSTDGTSRRRAAAAAENLDRVAQGLVPLYQLT